MPRRTGCGILHPSVGLLLRRRVGPLLRVRPAPGGEAVRVRDVGGVHRGGGAGHRRADGDRGRRHHLLAHTPEHDQRFFEVLTAGSLISSVVKKIQFVQ